MSKFLIYPLLRQVSAELKETMKDEFGNQPKLEQAQSGAVFACIDSTPVTRLLFKYRPFQKEGVFADLVLTALTVASWACVRQVVVLRADFINLRRQHLERS